MTAVPDLRRVLILATHPDDDVIGAGGVILRAIAGGGCVRVLFITNGESNTWPQRAMLRKWRITAADREDWARLRSDEAQRSLESLGARGGDCCFFLGYPDQRISELLRNGDTRLQSDLDRHGSEFRPTLVIVPSFFDIHTDHRATAWFAHKAFGPEIPIATYIVHGEAPPMRTLFTIRLTPAEQKRKRDAIACHESQLLLSRHRFLAHARATETFYAPEHDVIRVVTPVQERLAALHHALRAIAGSLRH
jgi:LmbE family N-acetylglucosaminyl deacetylase